jgi:thiamine pyrophosphokinase
VPRPSPATVVVFAGGGPVDRSLRAELDQIDYVIAADSGLYAAQRLGLQPDVLVGDLDSVDPAVVDNAPFDVDRHPRAKDRTDIVLALDRACELRPQRLIVVSGGGGRLDHAFANLLVLASPAYAAMQVDALVGTARLAVIRDQRELSGPPGRLISLFAVGGPAHGVTTAGLLYPLRDDVLDPTSSRGVSNEFIGGPARISLSSGTLLAIQPGDETSPPANPVQKPWDQESS